MTTSENTSKHRQLTDFERGEIVGAWKCGLTEDEIHTALERPKSTVHHVIEKYKKFGWTTAAPRDGRPRKLDDQDIRRLVNILKEDR